jgi:hypothetical protein
MQFCSFVYVEKALSTEKKTIRPQGLQIGFPNLLVSFYLALGPIQGHKVQHFISNLGQIEFFFSISA